MIRAIYTLLLGLVGGGLIHIAAVLGITHYSEPDHWTRFAAFGPNNHFNVLPQVSPTVQPLPLLDPAFAHAVCRFSLAAEPLRIRVVPPDTVWTMGFFDRHGANVYHFNDRAADLKPVELLVMTARQVARLRESPPDDLDSLTIVEWPQGTEGAALLRVFAPTREARQNFEDSLAQARCAPMSATN